MKILLLGEYSSLHNNLAYGLRQLGCEVCLVSGGDYWKDLDSDIKIRRKGYDFFSSLIYILQILLNLPRFRGYDVVQIINPCFFDIKVEKCWWIYKYLRRHNKKVFLGGFGVDHFWVKACLNDKTFRYSDFFVNGVARDNEYNRNEIADWIGSAKEDINKLMADDCNGIITGLYEYWAAYRPYYSHKMTYIPMPIREDLIAYKGIEGPIDKLRFFLGVQKERSQVKGTDVVEPILNKVVEKHSHLCEVERVESVPYEQYKEMLGHSHVLIDQIYSYTPAMNALLGMAKGLVVVSGGEPEHYALHMESENFPIVNVLPNEEDIFETLERLVLKKKKIPALSQQCIDYIRKYHKSKDVSLKYLDFWSEH